MTGFWSPVLKTGSGFFRAWGRALIESAPARLKPYLAVSRNPVRVEVTSLADLKGRDDLYGRDVDLALDQRHILEHTFTIPAGAARELGRVTQLEAARVMPINLEKLQLAYSVKDGNDRTIHHITLVAVRRSFVDQLLDHGRKVELTFRSILARSSNGDIHFSVPEIRYRKIKKIGVILASLVFFFLVLSQVPQFYFDQLVSSVAATDTAIRKARQKTAKISGLQQQVKSLQSLSDAVRQARQEGLVLEILSILTDASPDNVVIDEFRLDGRRMYLSGRAKQPEEWVIRLQQNTAFEDVRLTSVLGQQQNDIRRFEIHLNVKWPHERKDA